MATRAGRGNCCGRWCARCDGQRELIDRNSRFVPIWSPRNTVSEVDLTCAPDSPPRVGPPSRAVGPAGPVTRTEAAVQR